MDAISTHSEVMAVDATNGTRPASHPQTDAERLVWSHAYWARLNHENAQFIPTQARQCANEILAHAREMGVVDVMAAELKVTK